MIPLPDPLHPAIVHLPIALAVVLPPLALGAAVAIHRSALPARAWVAVVLFQLALVGSGWAALETGEAQEDRVERIVAERHIETHEERAEAFLALAGLTLLVAGAGLLPGRGGRYARGAAVAATCAVLAAGIAVGHSGGQLVYRYGAANAYAEAAPGATGSALAPMTARAPEGQLAAYDDDD